MKKKILIVDDEPDLLRIACFRLEKSGYQVLSAVNGKEGLEMVEKESPDLVLLDIKLPLIEGTDVCLSIKKNDKLKHTPVILFTASAQNIEERLKACGAEGYIIKPFSAEDLLEKVKKLIS